MAHADNITIVKRFFDEVINKTDVEAGNPIVADDFINHYSSMPVTQGIDAFKQMGQSYFDAFPDINVDVEQFIADGDFVVARWTWTGTNTGSFAGMPPTGKHVASRGIGIYRIANGKMAEQWVEEDTLGMLQQMGVIPMPEGAAA